jgi:hypothetical protein
VGKRADDDEAWEEPSVGDPGRVAAYSIRDVAERANVPEGFVPT